MSNLINIGLSNKPDRVGDVVFIHGLDGDALTTWQPYGEASNYWPHWLAERFHNIGVWSLDYEAASLAWKGTAMSLDERATEVLSVLEAHQVGTLPLIFITHSLGGLVAKRLLHNAYDSLNQKWKDCAKNTKGIVFLATPHSGSDLGSWLDYLGRKLSVLRVNVTAEDLRAHHPELRRLNTWFRDRVLAGDLSIDVESYYETQGVNGKLIVDETSANPGIPGSEPIPQDANHQTICKPPAKDSVLCRRIANFVERLFFC